ncbi:GNAT family N-acetyltransferase [Arthrobacter sp. FW305-BF8]|uniref:GNAT family N-acetyltransferase n=1 Tax=Arthrobacter sp. FW305-BF8 TaxID=2879617 RepID=UPI001F33D604|nr:GNAT family N-acetyltransferase [Arthrobacter sp. FW305-BF8]UKA56062.1 GNAT family N-acetyltransferase [Arthrobacter sp. FW305-BF8]
MTHTDASGLTADGSAGLPAVDFPELQWRSASPADLDAWAALIARTAAVEEPVWFERRADLEQIMESKNNPVGTNTVLGLDSDGVPRAYARLTKNKDGAKAHGFCAVDPQRQRRGVGTALLSWLEVRTRQRFAEDAGALPDDAGPAPRLRLFTEQKQQHQCVLLQESGYEVVRYYNEMHRPLSAPLPEAPLDHGLELVPMEPGLSEALRLAHNQVFADHWGSEPRDEESWGFVVNDPLARPDLSAVVLESRTGEIAGYQLASYDPDNTAARGFSEGYTDLLGVRREFRGRGIAQALLADAMRRFAAAGLDKASLDVDSENPTGAMALYRKMGYAPVNTSLAWDKVL